MRVMFYSSIDFHKNFRIEKKLIFNRFFLKEKNVKLFYFALFVLKSNLELVLLYLIFFNPKHEL